jgi:hypothetical protein
MVVYPSTLQGIGVHSMWSIDCDVDHVAKWLRNIAMALISIPAIFGLFYHLVSGVKYGFRPGGVLIDIILALIILAVAAIAWRWGFIGGIILLFLGLSVFFLYLTQLEFGFWAFIYALPTGLPSLGAGCLFLVSW